MIHWNWFLLENNSNSTTFRSQNSEHLIASLSKESVLKRRRRHNIGIQITAMSWLLEFLASIVSLLRYCIMGTGKNSEWIDRLSQLLVLFISYILVPGSYLLNDEVTKLLIVANGWTKFFRNNVAKCGQRREPSNQSQ